MNIEKFRGGWAIPDNEVISFYKNIDYSNVLIDKNPAIEFIYNFDKYIMSSKENKLFGLDEFKHKTFVHGTCLSFEAFWMRHHNRRFKCFKGEFFYHQANWKKFHRWDYIDDKGVSFNDAVVISLPFSDYCTEHSKMREVLDECEKLKVPVLIDCAYYLITKDINFNFSEYNCITDITFSLSKGFYRADKLRAGIRYSKLFYDDYVDIMNQYDAVSYLSAYVGNKIVTNFPPDYAITKFRDKQLKFCKDNNLVPSDCVIFAFGSDKYEQLKRETGVNRLCISDQIGDRIDEK
jgi:hypothetical protein